VGAGAYTSHNVGPSLIVGGFLFIKMYF
jgi:hypothetical protein